MQTSAARQSTCRSYNPGDIVAIMLGASYFEIPLKAYKMKNGTLVSSFYFVYKI